MALTDDELKRLAVDLLKAPTARDAQRTIGASNLANGCDHCLACNLLGDMRETPMLDRAYLGRVIGTALHGLLEERAETGIDSCTRQIEQRFIIGEIPGYGTVGSTADLFIVPEGHLVDWKGSKRSDILLLVDFLHMQRGLPAPFGRTHADIKLSEAKYAEAITKVEYKVTGYYAQLQLYGMGKRGQGYAVDRLSNVFIARDGTGWFDNPGLDGWEDDRKKHDVFVLSFDYDEAYAQMVWDRGVRIWQKLQNGATPDHFESNTYCFPCSLEERDRTKGAAVADVKIAA